MSEYKFWVVQDGQLHLFRNPHEDFEPDSNNMEWGSLEGIHFHDDEKTTWEDVQEEEEEGICECGGEYEECTVCKDKYKCSHCGLCECQNEEKKQEEEDCVYNFYICQHCCSEYDETEVDCKHCGRNRCVFLYQAKNKSEAIAMTKE